MDSRHVRMRPLKDVVALSEGVLDIPGLFRCQEGTDICEMSVFLRDLDCLQRIYRRGIFIRRIQ